MSSLFRRQKTHLDPAAASQQRQNEEGEQQHPKQQHLPVPPGAAAEGDEAASPQVVVHKSRPRSRTMDHVYERLSRLSFRQEPAPMDIGRDFFRPSG